MKNWFPPKPDPPPKVCVNGHQVDRLASPCPECGSNSFKIDRYALSELSPRDRSAVIRQCHLEGEFFVLDGPAEHAPPAPRPNDSPRNGRVSTPTDERDKWILETARDERVPW